MRTQFALVLFFGAVACVSTRPGVESWSEYLSQVAPRAAAPERAEWLSSESEYVVEVDGRAKSQVIVKLPLERQAWDANLFMDCVQLIVSDEQLGALSGKQRACVSGRFAEVPGAIPEIGVSFSYRGRKFVPHCIPVEGRQIYFFVDALC